MDRQVVFRLVLLGCIVTLVVLAALGDASRVLVYAVAVPFGFLAAGLFLLAAPFAAVRKAEGKRLGLRKLLDVAEHAGPLAWIDFLILWSTGTVAYLGLGAAGLSYRVVFFVAVVLGFFAAVADLYLSEEPDSEQEPWQEHPN